MAKSKQLGDCSILMAKRLVVPKTVLMVIQKDTKQITIQNDSQLVINSVKKKIVVLKDIVDLVTIKCSLPRFSDSRVE